MSILYYLLIVLGAIITGFVTGYLFFFIVTKFNDFRIRRVQKKLDKEKDMLKPHKIERGENDEYAEAKREFNEFREFEKLRTITKGKRRADNGIDKPSENASLPKPSELPVRHDSSPSTDKPKFKFH